MSKQTAVVICPGRGTYNQGELGYLSRYHNIGSVKCDKEISNFIEAIDQAREQAGQITVSDLDKSEKYRSRIHGTGDNASALIYACAMSDLKKINRDKYDIVAVTGNSMGWYLALASAGVLQGNAGFDVVNTMGTLMHTDGVGGQVIYPLVDSNWQYDPSLAALCDQLVDDLNQNENIQIAISIELGGMRVLAANDEGIKALLEKLPPQQDRFPFQLHHHSAFHSSILKHIPEIALTRLSKDLFQSVKIPLVDGQGEIWRKGTLDLNELYEYTFNQQVTETYNFSSAIEVCVKEFSPEKLIVLGPGSTLGPPVAQKLIDLSWMGLDSKERFISEQKENPFLLSMGIAEQRAHVI